MKFDTERIPNGKSEGDVAKELTDELNRKLELVLWRKALG